MTAATTPMFFPREVHLTDRFFVLHKFGPGVCEVPTTLASHNWLKVNKVVPYKPEETK